MPPPGGPAGRPGGRRVQRATGPRRTPLGPAGRGSWDPAPSTAPGVRGPLRSGPSTQQQRVCAGGRGRGGRSGQGGGQRGGQGDGQGGGRSGPAVVRPSLAAGLGSAAGRRGFGLGRLFSGFCVRGVSASFVAGSPLPRAGPARRGPAQATEPDRGPAGLPLGSGGWWEWGAQNQEGRRRPFSAALSASLRPCSFAGRTGGPRDAGGRRPGSSHPLPGWFQRVRSLKRSQF